ncbi:TIGR03016 family PEP-CTERM system-associated outer membrane protein [Trichloromonas sp.]|uniref:TIGR03016 family PEP-CTERM system-associated outer membrane protein n=1 Tax=Trichloromonas sp. TaxID=3069249 RepID=UPI002A3DC004|nr:TIGR03016 family PEP-CTERM system-associated outer membrane protein [Trichloromonas sp.]
MMMKFQKSAVALLLALIFAPGASWAEFRATPAFSLRQEYNDNIYLEKDKEGDFVTFVRPSVSALWNTRVADLTLDLGVGYEKYWENSDDDELRPTARLDSTFSLYRENLFLRVTDIYDRVTIDEGGKGAVDNNLINMTDSNRLEVNPYLVLQPLRTLQARFDYLYENVWYREDEGDDAETHRYAVTLTQQFTPRISVDLSGAFSQFRPKDAGRSLLDDTGEEEYDRTNAGLGLFWQVNDQFSLRGDVGRAWLDYEYSDDYDSTLFGGQADYQISSVLSVGAAYEEDISASVEDGARERQEVSAYLAYANRSKVRLTVFQSREDYLEIDRQDDGMGATLDGDVPITNKKGIAWLLSYTDYEEGDLEEYQRYGGRLEFYHQLRLGRLSLGYTYNRNDSDMPSEDYDNNIVFAQVALRW